MPISKAVICCVPGGAMAGGLDDFQKFRADLNEEVLGCGHLGIKRFFALDHQAYEPGPLGTKTKELLASSPAPCYAATTASPTISCAAAKRAGSATRSSTPSTSLSLSAAPSPSRTSAAPSPACAKSTTSKTPDVTTTSHHELVLFLPRAVLKHC